MTWWLFAIVFMSTLIAALVAILVYLQIDEHLAKRTAWDESSHLLIEKRETYKVGFGWAYSVILADGDDV